MAVHSTSATAEGHKQYEEHFLSAAKDLTKCEKFAEDQPHVTTFAGSDPAQGRPDDSCFNERAESSISHHWTPIAPQSATEVPLLFFNAVATVAAAAALVPVTTWSKNTDTATPTDPNQVNHSDLAAHQNPHCDPEPKNGKPTPGDPLKRLCTQTHQIHGLDGVGCRFETRK